jgi:hypothetical protein
MQFSWRKLDTTMLFLSDTGMSIGFISENRAIQFINNEVGFRDRSLLRDQLYWPKPGKLLIFDDWENSEQGCLSALLPYFPTALLWDILPIYGGPESCCIPLIQFKFPYYCWGKSRTSKQFQLNAYGEKTNFAKCDRGSKEIWEK